MKYVAIFSVILISAIALIAANSNIVEIKVDSEEKSYIGKNIKFNEKMIYLSNLKKGGVMNDKVNQTGRLLMGKGYSNFFPDNYYLGNKKNVSEIRPEMSFTVIESFIAGPTGFYNIFNDDHREFIVKDENGNMSVVYSTFVKKDDWKN